MTRVLLVGDASEGSLLLSLARGLQDVRCVPTVLDLSDLAGRHAAWSLAYHVPSLGGLIRQRIVERVRKLPPASADVVIVVKGPFISGAVIELLRKRLEGPVVCWNPDSPYDFALSNRGAGIGRAVSSYDWYVTWASDVAEQVQRFNPNVVVLPFAWDPHTHQPTTGEGVASGRVVFVGTWTAERQAWLERISSWEPLVVGSGWPRTSSLDVRPPIVGREFARLAGEANWSLNFLRPQNRLSHNMRTFEIPGCRGRQLAQWSPQHEELLGGLAASRLFRTAAELEEVLRSAELPRAEGMDEWLSRNTYAERLRTLLDLLGYGT